MSYEGSQLAYALHYLHIHHNVSLVSLMIGANDGFAVHRHDPASLHERSRAGPLKRTITRNIHHILHAIRDTAHYSGQLVIVNYYAPAAGRRQDQPVAQPDPGRRREAF